MIFLLELDIHPDRVVQATAASPELEDGEKFFYNRHTEESRPSRNQRFLVYLPPRALALIDSLSLSLCLSLSVSVCVCFVYTRFVHIYVPVSKQVDLC